MHKFIQCLKKTQKAILVCLGIAVLGIFTYHLSIAQYNGNGNHAVPLTDAKRYIQNFKNNPTAPTTKANYFERNIFDKILAQPGCVGIRMYYAKTDAQVPTLVIVGVNGNGADMTDGTIGELAYPCPPICDGNSPLSQ